MKYSMKEFYKKMITQIVINNKQKEYFKLFPLDTPKSSPHNPLKTSEQVDLSLGQFEHGGPILYTGFPGMLPFGW